MKRYTLAVEVKLIELPNQFEEPPEPFSDDPMKMLNQVASKMVAQPMITGHFQPPAGFDFRRAVNITVSHFAGLAKIISQYDELTQQIESEMP